VQVRTGGNSPRPRCLQQRVDVVKLHNRRWKSGWEVHASAVCRGGAARRQGSPPRHSCDRM